MQYLPNPDEQKWLTRYMRRLIENMGWEQFVLAPILVPSRRWFPEEWSDSIYDAHLVTQRLMHYAKLDTLDVVIEGFIEMHDAPTESGDASGYFTGIENDVAYFGLKQSTLADPEIAAGTMAHEVAHAWRTFHRDRLEPAAKDQEEILTDITTVYLGFGVLTTNDSYRFRSHGDMRRQSWGSSSYGYLPLQAMSFLLGMQLAARNRDEEIESITSQLEPNQKRAVLETLDVFAEEDILELLALPPRETWPEPDREPHEIDVHAPDETHAIEIPNPLENPLRNKGQYVYRSDVNVRGAAPGQRLIGALFGSLVIAVGIGALINGERRLIGIVILLFGLMIVLMSSTAKMREPEQICGDADCHHPLTHHDAVCPGCGGTIAESAEDALERNAATVEYTECEECEPEHPCVKHAS